MRLECTAEGAASHVQRRKQKTGSDGVIVVARSRKSRNISHQTLKKKKDTTTKTMANNQFLSPSVVLSLAWLSNSNSHWFIVIFICTCRLCLLSVLSVKVKRPSAPNLHVQCKKSVKIMTLFYKKKCLQTLWMCVFWGIPV